MSNALVHGSKLSVGQQGTLILKEINLEVLSGQSLAIVGPNGAGKTTLLRSLAGLITHARGEISIKECNPLKTSPKIISEFLTYLPQNPICAWDFTVGDFGELSTHPDLYAHWINRFKLKEKLGSPLSQLSGGEKKSVHLSLAFSVLGNPLQKILLLDEPTAALDHERAQLVSLAIKEFTEAGAAVLCATHDMLLAQSCQEILVLEAGRVIQKSPPAGISTAELIKLIGNK
jgi:ABC-type multidrug transport system ATPase subunit